MDNAVDQLTTISLNSSAFIVKVNNTEAESVKLVYPRKAEGLGYIHVYTREVKEWHWITYPWAIMEDMTAFIRKLQPAATCADDVINKLREEFNLEVPGQILNDALKLSDMEFK